MVKRGVMAGVAVVSMLALLGCGDKTIDATSTEESITDFVSTETGFAAEDMSCPDDVPAEVDETFECTFTGPDGDYVAEATVTAVNDDQAEFDITTRPVE